VRGPEQDVPAALALELAAQRIEAEIGLDFRGAKRRQLHAALGRMAATLGLPGAHACAAWLLSGSWDDARSDLCARFLTIGETYFFREPRALDLVCERARAHLASGERRPLRIWSAGCCTGEEPYSIAMALCRRVRPLAAGMAPILATDLNEAFLGFARAGIYRRWSFRRTDPADQKAFFRPLDDGRFEIDPALREQIRFARLNLAGADYPRAATGTLGMDIVFCRNVLMYFGREQVKAVVARLRDSLVDGGWLVVNASEASPELFRGFIPVYHEDAVYFQKRDTQPAEAPLPPPARPARPARQGPRSVVTASPAPRASAARDVPGRAPRAYALRQQDEVMARVRSLADAGSREEALQCLRRAVEAAPLSALLQQDAALFAFEHGDRALARHGVKCLLYLDPDNAMGHYLAALIEDAEGHRAQALRLLHRCRRLVSAGAGVDEDLGGAVEQWLERMR
jgi:chemotaxis protein methyltransferase CheR